MPTSIIRQNLKSVKCLYKKTIKSLKKTVSNPSICLCFEIVLIIIFKKRIQIVIDVERNTFGVVTGGGGDRDGNKTDRRRNTSVQRPAASQSQRVRRAVWFDVAFVGYVWLARRLSVRYHRLTAKHRRTDWPSRVPSVIFPCVYFTKPMANFHTDRSCTAVAR